MLLVLAPIPISTMQDVLAQLVEQDASYVPQPLRFAVGSVIRHRYPRPAALKRYGVSELRYEVFGVNAQSRMVTLRKLFTKTTRRVDVLIECVNAWYDEVDLDINEEDGV